MFIYQSYWKKNPLYTTILSINKWEINFERSLEKCKLNPVKNNYILTRMAKLRISSQMLVIHRDWNSHVSDGSLKWYNCFGILIDLIKVNYMYIQ